jgi:hypothetical protein
VRLQKLTESRTYERFMLLSKLELRVQPFCDSHAVSRYGITFNVNFERSKELKEIDRFFYLHFKVIHISVRNVTTERTKAFEITQTIPSSTWTPARSTWKAPPR